MSIQPVSHIGNLGTFQDLLGFVVFIHVHVIWQPLYSLSPSNAESEFCVILFTFVVDFMSFGEGMGRFKIRWSRLPSRLSTINLNFKNYFPLLLYQATLFLFYGSTSFQSSPRILIKFLKLFLLISELFVFSKVSFFFFSFCAFIVLENEWLLIARSHSWIKRWVANVDIWHECPLNMYSSVSWLSPSPEWEG